MADSSITASFEILPDAGRTEEKVRLIGEDYCVDVWTGMVHPWRVEAWRNDKLVFNADSPPDQPRFIRGGSYAETSAFLEALLAGRPLPSPSPADALASSELAAMIQE